MNTMELVHIVSERAHPRPTASRPQALLFTSELIGPTRQAVLRARDVLLSEQRDDGSWLGTQTGDASWPSQLVFYLAYREQEQGELAQRAVATILDQQLPSGGWSLAPGGPADVSTSVQAYFALKLTGVDPSDDRLARARQVIRKIGGADMANSTTRFFLALLGQIDYDHCPVIPPELLLWDSPSLNCAAPLSLIWSHRPVRRVGIGRGVRELFVNKPGRWPRQIVSQAIGRPRKFWAVFRLLGEAAYRYCDRRGWTPLRRRALDRAEAQLLERIEPDRIEQLGFLELIWHCIALHIIGYAADSREVRACDEQLHEMVCVDEDRDRAAPQIRRAPFADTALVARALYTSGLPLNHPTIATAGKFLSQLRRLESHSNLEELASIAGMLSTAMAHDAAINDALPPDIQVGREHRHRGNAVSRANRRPHRIRSVFRALTARLVQMQNSDGGWSIGDNNRRIDQTSASSATAAILDAIAAANCEVAQAAKVRAISYLRAAQRADGSWENDAPMGIIHATSLAIRGLLAAGVPRDDDAVAAAINWLIVHQHPGGGWGEPASNDSEFSGYCSEIVPTKSEPRMLDFSPTATHTAWALSALVKAGQADSSPARRAVNFLIEMQEDDGRWREKCFLSRDAASGRSFRNDLHAVAWPLMALSQWAIAATASQADRCDQFALRLVGASAER